MVAFQGILLTSTLVLLLFTGVHGNREGRVVVTERRTNRSSSASAYASASSSSSSSVTTYVRTESSNGAPSETPKKEKKASPKAPVKPPPPPKNVTERIREAILNGSVETISWLLAEHSEISELAHGFKFPEEKREDYLITTPGRKTDPDVIALKGMAHAAVDHGIAKKLTDVFVFAIYGADFDTNVCPEEPEVTYSKKVKENRTTTTTTYGYTKITNASGTYTVYDAPKTETKYWENSYTSDGIDLDMEVEAMASVEAEEYIDPTDCHTKEEIQKIRSRLLEDFKNKKLMKEIIRGHPRPKGWRRRSLFVIGTPVSSWLCSECWKPKFCNKNVYWCPQ